MPEFPARESRAMRIASGEHSRARFRAILRNGAALKEKSGGMQDPFRLALPSEIQLAAHRSTSS